MFPKCSSRLLSMEKDIAEFFIDHEEALEFYKYIQLSIFNYINKVLIVYHITYVYKPESGSTHSS